MDIFKNQTIYIDTSKSMNSVQINNETTAMEELIQQIKEMINKIF